MSGNRVQVRFGGYGGQGIVLAGMLLGKAATLYEGREAVFTQAYGPEARGGASRADVIIDDETVDYPYVTEPDVLAVLFQEAYSKYALDLAPEGLLILDRDLVTPENDRPHISLPATRIAEELGNRIVANMVLLGCMLGSAQVVSREALEQAMRETVKASSIELNLRALQAGLEHAESVHPGEPVGNSVLVLGGGLIGLQAASELSRAGARTVVLEQGPILGGKRAALLHGTEEPWCSLKSVAAEPSVDYFTQSHLQSIEGEAGAFRVSFSQQPRLVTDDCTRCAHCVPVCPQVAANEYDAGLTFRKAISSPLPETIPDIYAIDLDSCLNTPPNYLPCQRCVEVCDDNAIHFDMPVPAPSTLEVCAVVVATGYADNDALERERLTAFDYGAHADILSSVELQRLLEDPGPSGGFAVRPSDESYPESLLLVLTDVSTGAAWVMGNQLRRLVAQDVQPQVLVLAADTEDAALAPLLEAANECGATVVCGSWIDASADEQNRVCVRYATLPGGTSVQLTSDLVVLSSEIHPPQETAALAATLGLEVGAAGYLVPGRDGIYLAGGALGTVGIEAGTAQAQEAVKNALAHLDSDDLAATDESAPGEQAPLENMQREQLEQLLYSLMKLGEGDRP